VIEIRRVIGVAGSFQLQYRYRYPSRLDDYNKNPMDWPWSTWAAVPDVVFN